MQRNMGEGKEVIDRIRKEKNPNTKRKNRNRLPWEWDRYFERTSNGPLMRQQRWELLQREHPLWGPQRRRQRQGQQVLSLQVAE